MLLYFRSAIIGAAAAALIGAGAAEAERFDQDAARLAVERGEIRPLADILEALRGKLPGEIAGIEIDRKDGRWLYEFRVVGATGRLFEVYVDGLSAEIQRIKEK